jgi:hypothetical protein
MGGLKILVIVMGVAILAGVGALGVLIVGKMAKPPAPSAPGGAGAPFTAPPLGIPAGARIEDMATGTDRLVLDLALADGSHELVVIDLNGGRKLGTIPLRPGR